MKRWLIAAGTVLFLVLGYWYLSRPEPVGVTLVPVEKGLVEKTVANTRAGTVEACARSKLSLAIGGQIARIYVTEGDRVQQGQLLMSLWNLDRVARLNEARAAQKSVMRERESLCITAGSDTREARRLTKLAAEKLVAEDVADLAKSKAEASAVACEGARARDVQAAASVEVARSALELTELRAPFAGIVAEVTGEVGEYSTPSPPGVATPEAIDLLTDDCHYVTTPIDEVDASEIAPGMPARVTMDAFRGRDFAATVKRIAPYVLDIEKQARTVDVDVEFDQLPGDLRLLAGYSADMEVILEARPDVLRVPSELVMEDSYVLVLEEGLLRKQPIVAGIANWLYTEVVEGLQAGDLIVGNVGETGVLPGARAIVRKGAGNASDD